MLHLDDWIHSIASALELSEKIYFAGIPKNWRRPGKLSLRKDYDEEDG